jgi:hypothetical protein
MKKLLFSLLFLTTGILCATAQTMSQSQPGIGDNPTLVKVTVFPNPVKDIVNVNFDTPVKQPIVETFNVNGQRVLAPSNGHNDASGNTSLDMSAFAPGLYVVKVYSGNEIIHVQKILKD